MKLKVLLYSLLFLQVTFSIAQNEEAPTKIPIYASTYLGQDNLGAYYYEDNNILFKKEDHKIYEYTNLSLGEIKSIDISNPLRPVLLYEDTQHAILLDNQLNEIENISFTITNPFLVVNHVSYASMNKLWVYEQCSNRVFLYDRNTNNLQQLTTVISPEVIYIQTNMNTAYWVDAENNWYRCNIFGETKLIARLPKFNTIQIINHKHALLHINESLYKYHAYSKKFNLIYPDLKSDIKYYYSNQFLSIFTDKQIISKKIKL